MEPENSQTTTPPSSAILPTTQTPPQSTPEITPPSSNKKYLLWGGIGVLILLLLGATGYFAYQNMQLKNQPLPTSVETNITKPTTESNTRWVKYINLDSQYGISYPTPQLINCFSPNLNLFVINLNSTIDSPSYECLFGPSDAISTISARVVEMYEPYKQPATTEQMTVAAQSAQKFTFQLTVEEDGPISGAKEMTEVVVPHPNGGVVILRLISSDEELKTLFNQMLSTLDLDF